MRFDDLFARADDATLQRLVGTPALRLLNALDPGLNQPSRLKQVLVGLYGREGLLEDSTRRAHLLELLKPHEAGQLAQALGVDDAPSTVYGTLTRLSVARGSQRERRLYGYFELSPPADAAAPASPSQTVGAAAYGLFPHQRRATRRVSAELAGGAGRVLLHMPTGSGKTRTAMSAIADHLRDREPGLVIWLAYSEELCEQAADEFAIAWEALGNRDVALHRYWGAHTLDVGTLRDGVLIAGLAKTYRLAIDQTFAIGQLASRCTLVVMDEAHQAVAPTYQLVLNALLVRHPQPGLLGLTATPGRTWSDIDADEQLATFFSGRKVMLEVDGYANPVDYLVEEGYLAKAAFEPLFVHSGLALSAADRQRLRDALDVPESVLRQLADDEQRNLGIINRLEELLARHHRVLLFATTVEHSDLIATVLQARDIAARSVTGRSPAGERAAAIAAFRAEGGAPMVLCNYGVLTTGFDAPRTSAVLIARPTKSLVLYSQMVGRATRGTRAGGNAAAEIVTVIDSNLPGFESVASAFINWEDVWQQPSSPRP